MRYKLCPDCNQPMLPKGRKKKPGEFDHASGCPRDIKKQILTSVYQTRVKLLEMLRDLPDYPASRKQLALYKLHGTPHEFAKACIECIPEISYDEVIEAVAKYLKEWRSA